MSNRKSRFILALLMLQSLAIFLVMFFTPSEPKSIVFLWFSKSRFVLVTGFGAFFILQALFSLYFFWRPQRLVALYQRAESTLIDKNGLITLLLVIGLLFSLGVFATITVLTTPLDFEVYGKWAPTFPNIYATVTVLLPLIVGGLIFLLETALWIVIQYRPILAHRSAWTHFPIIEPLGIVCIFILSLLHWIILVFRHRLFLNQPAWYWDVTNRPYGFRDVLWILIAACGLLFTARLFRNKKIWLGLACLLVLGFLVQFTPALLNAEGMPFFQNRYFASYHSTYPRFASKSTVSLLNTVVHYEKLYGTYTFTATKPPGLMFLYQALERLVNGAPTSGIPAEARFERLKTVITFLFPFLAALLLLWMHRFARTFLDENPSGSYRLAPFLLVFAPNFVLFTLFADQAIYPGLFILGVSLIVLLLRRQSIPLAFVLGVCLYGLNFFAFTMLPLFPVMAFYLFVRFWIFPKVYTFWKQASLLVSTLVGVIFSYLAARWFLNYEGLARLARTMKINHNFDFYTRVDLQPPLIPEDFITRLRQMGGALVVNQSEIATAVGLGVYFVFVLGALRLLSNTLSRKISSGDVVLVSILLSFVLLNMMGTLQGEVARLWLFWTPMIAWVAVREIRRWHVPQMALILGLSLTQLITMILTYHFQDFIM